MVALQARASKIFVSGSGGPMASHEPPLATESTNMLVKLALEAVKSGTGVLVNASARSGTSTEGAWRLDFD